MSARPATQRGQRSRDMLVRQRALSTAVRSSTDAAIQNDPRRGRTVMSLGGSLCLGYKLAISEPQPACNNPSGGFFKTASPSSGCSFYRSLQEAPGDFERLRFPDASGSCGIRIRFDEGRPAEHLPGRLTASVSSISPTSIWTSPAMRT